MMERKHVLTYGATRTDYWQSVTWKTNNLVASFSAHANMTRAELLKRGPLCNRATGTSALFVCRWFDDAVTTSCCKASSIGLALSNELDGMWKEPAVQHPGVCMEELRKKTYSPCHDGRCRTHKPETWTPDTGSRLSCFTSNWINSMEQSPSWKAKNSPRGMEPEGSLPHSQQPLTSPYPGPDRASTYLPISPLEYRF